jgi:hypothetical protein
MWIPKWRGFEHHGVYGPSVPPAELVSPSTSQTFHVHAALRMESTAAVAYTGTLAALCIATGVLYSRVYASDPGKLSC